MTTNRWVSTSIITDDGSIQSTYESFVGSIKAISLTSEVAPVKLMSSDNIEKRFDNIEKKIQDLRMTQDENRELEVEWLRHHDEIFDDATSIISRRSCIEKNKEDFFKKMSKPKRIKQKIKTDGRSKTFMDEIERVAVDNLR